MSRAGAASGPGLIKCFLPQGLPPLVDFSVFEATRDRPQLHVWRLEGIAPDGVVRIGLISRTGKLVAKVPVSRGIYYLASAPKIPVGLDLHVQRYWARHREASALNPAGPLTGL